VVAADGDLPARLVGTALQLLGTPYRAGGRTPTEGFDCSGFIAWVFGRVGLAVPRTVRSQYEASQPVDRVEARAGDLLFFDPGRTGEPTHVALALGDGRFVHAPSSRGVVRIEPLAAGYWASRYVGARRFVH
jgi:cell wall-associated NlpC family hydrolase